MVPAPLLAHHVLEPKPDFVLGFHTWPDTPAGMVGVRFGASHASSDAIKIKVKGKGGHGAHPYRCIDPVVAACYMVTQMQNHHLPRTVHQRRRCAHLRPHSGRHRGQRHPQRGGAGGHSARPGPHQAPADEGLHRAGGQGQLRGHAHRGRGDHRRGNAPHW